LGVRYTTAVSYESHLRKEINMLLYTMQFPTHSSSEQVKLSLVLLIAKGLEFFSRHGGEIPKHRSITVLAEAPFSVVNEIFCWVGTDKYFFACEVAMEGPS
jgi:hypothetical protein